MCFSVGETSEASVLDEGTLPNRISEKVTQI